MNTPPLMFGRKGRNATCALSSRLSLSPYAHGAIGCGKKKARKENLLAGAECQKSGGAGGTASCRGYRGGAPNPCAAALSPQTSVALFAGAGGQLGVFRQAEAELRKKLRLGYINRNDVQDYSLFVREHIV